jgi:hypothetical protein
MLLVERPTPSAPLIFRKRALQLVALWRKMTCNWRHPIGLRHPVPRTSRANPVKWHSTHNKDTLWERLSTSIIPWNDALSQPILD